MDRQFNARLKWVKLYELKKKQAVFVGTVVFRKRIYNSLDELQKDLDDWLNYYNHQRTHQDKMCCGRTPIETLLDGKKSVKKSLVIST